MRTTSSPRYGFIGRSYAAAIERRREKGEFSGDEFYVEHVASRIRSSDIDAWFQELRQDVRGNAAAAVKVHKNFTDLLNEITGLDKRSFASKYLHFHFRSRFFIYDTRAEKSVGQLVNDHSPNRHFSEGKRSTDAAYARFFSRCEQLSRSIRDLIGQDLDPREVDKVLLAWSRLIAKAQAIAALLEIRAPDETASADDWRVWVAWWEPSYEAARGLSEEQKRYLKAGGWWPPVTAAHIRPAPEIVIRTRRPGLFRRA